MDNLETNIAELESRVAAIDDQFSDPVFFARTAPDEVRKLSDEKKSIQFELDKQMERWTVVQTELSALRDQYGLGS